jgi:hypothetical protein
MARAYALDGDLEKARKAYDVFFALWKEADLGLPVLINARKDYGALR